MTDPTASNVTRRRVLKTSAAAGLAAPLAGTATAQTRPARAKQDDAAEGPVVRVAQVGAGGRGNGVREGLVSHPATRMVGLCDVDRNTLQGVGEQFPDAQRFTDFRAMLAALGDEIDAVAVSCPDHTHAPAAVQALRMGKHLYCEKPLAHTLRETRLLQELAEETGLVTQMGNQAHSDEKHDRTLRQLQAGAIGKVERVHAWSNRPIWPQGGDKPEGSDPVPNHLHWYEWLSVAADRPYVEGAYHSFAWRGFWDFGTGALGDMGCHIMDVVVHALGMTNCLTVVCEPEQPTRYMHPTAETIKMTFAPTEYTVDGGATMTWYDGGRRPNTDTEPLLRALRGKVRLSDNGRIFVGETGIIVDEHYGGIQWFDLEGNAMEPPEVEATGVHHQRSFIDAVLGEAGANRSHFGVACPLTEVCLVGALASRFPGVELAWDTEALAFTNSDEANAFVHKTYREGWEVEGL